MCKSRFGWVDMVRGAVERMCSVRFPETRSFDFAGGISEEFLSPLRGLGVGRCFPTAGAVGCILAPLCGLGVGRCFPTAGAVGCILAPLCGFAFPMAGIRGFAVPTTEILGFTLSMVDKRNDFSAAWGRWHVWRARDMSACLRGDRNGAGQDAPRTAGEMPALLAARYYGGRYGREEFSIAAQEMHAACARSRTEKEFRSTVCAVGGEERSRSDEGGECSNVVRNMDLRE